MSISRCVVLNTAKEEGSNQIQLAFNHRDTDAFILAAKDRGAQMEVLHLQKRFLYST